MSVTTFRIILFLFLPLFGTSIAGKTNLCPEMCKCSRYMEANYVNCSSRNLISGSLDLNKHVEYFDLSHNYISILENADFGNLPYLEVLNLKHNAIHIISLDVFRTLKNLRTIDLSFNRLELIDSELFESNRKLTHVNLAGNKFTDLSNLPILQSKSIKTLNLSSSEISAIYPDSFVLLPNLETLDLSNNLLVTINPNYFPLNTLHYINILNNKLVCDKKLRAILTKLDDMKVKYDVIKCVAETKTNSVMLERLLDVNRESDEAFVSEEDNSTEDAEVFDWDLHTDHEVENSLTCTEVLKNPKSINQCGTIDKHVFYHSLNMHEICNKYRITLVWCLAFVLMGFSLGVFTIHICEKCKHCTSDPEWLEPVVVECEPGERIQSSHTSEDSEEPVMMRVSRRRRRRDQSDRRSSDDGNFFRKLFSRRRRYYQRVNDNVRRLSRSASALFLNRLRSVNDQNDFNSPPSPLQMNNTVQLAERNNIIRQISTRENNDSFRNENRYGVIIPRGETPPPEYIEAVKR